MPFLIHQLDYAFVSIQKMFDSQMFTAREIIDEIHLITMDMNTKWQLDGKNVDET